MKHFSSMCTHSNHALLSSPRLVKRPFSEEDILYLQDAFLRNSFHYIAVETITSGRSIIYALLESLNYHRDITCLTLVSKRLRNSVVDIYDECMKYGLGARALEEYLVEHFYGDFMWVECTPEGDIEDRIAG